MRTLHNSAVNPTCWNKIPSMQGGTTMSSIGEDKCYLPKIQMIS
ncbi:MAG: hypothetical protein U0T76_12660 [Saprospiraceae bacterium]|nr:MAG: hypothetical protein QY315_06770 [Saprospiraceae bacterium]HNO72008.1 hypothetical protein [Bacteroidia bacterium]